MCSTLEQSSQCYVACSCKRIFDMAQAQGLPACGSNSIIYQFANTVPERERELVIVR
jgi:hypothetical protein